MALPPYLNPLNLIGSPKVILILRPGQPVALIGLMAGSLASLGRTVSLMISIAKVGLIEPPAMLTLAFPFSLHPDSMPGFKIFRQSGNDHSIIYPGEEDGRR